MKTGDFRYNRRVDDLFLIINFVIEKTCEQNEQKREHDEYGRRLGEQKPRSHEDRPIPI